MKELGVQLDLIRRIKENIPANLSLADEIGEILGLSTDSTYRRIRGETALSLDEAVKLCRHYNISFDIFVGKTKDAVTFSYQSMENTEDCFEAYLKKIHSDLKGIENYKEKKIIFAAEDVPVFHHFAFPDLTAFKFFYWQRSIMNVPSFEGMKYEAVTISKDLKETAEEIVKIYNRIPSIEIWSEDTVNSTLKQIEFYWESGLFLNKEDAILICEQLEAMLKQIQKQAEGSKKNFTGKPGQEGNYSLYFSDIMIGNNCILVTMDGSRAVYLSYNTFNTMLTTNEDFCDKTELWLQNLIRKSNLISGVGEKQRYQFFKKVFDRLGILKSRITDFQMA